MHTYIIYIVYIVRLANNKFGETECTIWPEILVWKLNLAVGKINHVANCTLL